MRPTSAVSFRQALQAASRVVPTGLVEDHDRVFVLTNCRSEVVVELLYRLGVGVGQNEGEAVGRCPAQRK
jgi:hypothetical protein